MFQPPDYAGGSLLNLIAEIEHRLTGVALAPRLHEPLGRLIEDADTYVLFLADGLGARQLSHPGATPLAASAVGEIDAPFPTTTTVSWATIATGMAPRQHGLIGYQLYLPETDGVVYTIKWTRGWGEDVAVDHDGFLPSPNLWERLSAAGVEPITVQPGNFAGTKLSSVLYRGCRFEPAYSAEEMVDATVQLAATTRRFIVTYLPHIDVAAHVYGQESPEYADALEFVGRVWEQLVLRLPDGVVMVGTADHGHIDYPKSQIASIERADEKGRAFYGDSRAMFVKGDGESLAEYLPATWLPFAEVSAWWGPGPDHPKFTERAPDGVLMADEGHILMHKHSDDRMVGHHGGLEPSERRIPLLLAKGSSSTGLS
ncbi:MAG: hypothetical protein HKN91_01055 [Acidimicrobiia bacterium]|nr:hypothetical protein [Acidimicrobiia bacterium]